MNRIAAVAAAVTAAVTLTGCAGGGASAAPTTTVTTRTVTVTASPSDTATDDTSTAEATPDFSAAPSDFRLSIKTLSKACYGSAGCTVTFRVIPVYFGDPVPDGTTLEVTYEIDGAESPYTNTFTMTGTDAQVPEKEIVETATVKDITVKVTDVSVQ